MNTKLKIVQRRIDAVDIARDTVNETMKKVFPKGQKIVFKRSNMKSNAHAIVKWAHMINGHASLRITNTQTRKDSTISFDDVVYV